MAEHVPRIILIGRNGNGGRIRNLACSIYHDAFKRVMEFKQSRPDQIDFDFPCGLKGIAGAIWSSEAVRYLMNNGAGIKTPGRWLFDNISDEMKERSPVVAAGDLNDIKEANLIVSASSSPEPIIFPGMLGNGPIVICDIAVPLDTDISVEEERDDVTVIQGGIVSLPCNSDFSIRGIALEPGQSYACMAETILMGLSGIKENYSCGKIDKDRVQRIMEIAEANGFSLAGIKKERSY